MLYARRYNPGKWHQYEYSTTQRISTDALTQCLKTENNTLSLWKVDSIENLDNQGALALIGAMTAFDKIDVILFTDEELKELGVLLSDSNGNTKVEDLKGTHTDIADLDMSSFTVFADFFARKLSDLEARKKELDDLVKSARKDEERDKYKKEILQLHIRRYTQPTVLKMYQKAVDEKRILVVIN